MKFISGIQPRFAASRKTSVDATLARALALGGTCLGPRGESATGLYAAYFRDPDDNKVMLMHLAA